MSETKWAIEIGSRVHFVYGGQHVPAIVTDPAFQDHGIDGQDDVRILQALTVFLPNAEPFTTVAEQMGEIAPGTWQNATWHWPEGTPVAYGDSDGGTDDGELCEASDVPTPDVLVTVRLNNGGNLDNGESLHLMMTEPERDRLIAEFRSASDRAHKVGIYRYRNFGVLESTDTRMLVIPLASIAYLS